MHSGKFGKVEKMKSGIEKALFVEDKGQLRQWDKSFNRIYFGAEFCERLLPNKNDFLVVKKFCEKQGVGFSFVTPFLTDSGMKSVLPLVKILSAGDELVVNDYGLLHAAKESRAMLVAGRLLNRQYRDPRILSFKAKVPKEFYAHLMQSHAANSHFQKFLQQNGVARVELDNLLQGIGTDLSKSSLRCSLHFPFCFVSATRLCLAANCDKISFHGKIGVFLCNKECRLYQFKLGNSFFPTALYLFGNAVFFQNNELPKEKELLLKGIDRLVINKSMQL
ncbi:MAG: hypothetical protein Q8N60_03400 [Candidatus Diapherotrites archaeon]|nr:hypothetical protein [Candidatus Diapherotrites archaeon]